ncbi:hypothetical protein ACVXHA_22035 [Escherichia coli]
MATFVSDVIANKMFIRAAGEGGAVRKLVNNWSAGLTVGVFHDTRFIHLPFALFEI